MAFSPQQPTCAHCQGRGTVLVVSARVWQTCSHCLGTGRKLSPEQMRRFSVVTGRLIMSHPEEE